MRQLLCAARSRVGSPATLSLSLCVSVFLARPVLPGYRSRLPPSSLFSPSKSRRRIRPSLSPLSFTPRSRQDEVRRSRRRRRPLWRLDRLGIGCRARSPGCRRSPGCAPPRCRPHPALDQACVSVSIFPLSRARDGRVLFKQVDRHVPAQRILTLISWLISSKHTRTISVVVSSMQARKLPVGAQVRLFCQKVQRN